MTVPLTREALETALAEAHAQRNVATDALAQNDFSGTYPGAAPWAIGPFTQDPSMTFELTTQWSDPTGIGWTSSSIFNPSIIEHGGEVLVFYRASPRKESMSSRIGLARLTASGWVDAASNPLVYPTLDNEVLGCEDPKVYEADGRYFLFYNGIFPVDEHDRTEYPSPGYPVKTVGCDINLAVSEDLEYWQKLGPILNHETSRLWAKGAVIPRSPDGSAARVGGEYLMYLSEGCNGREMIGHSDDMLTWRFEEQSYLSVAGLGGHLYEVGCATTGHDGTALVLDFFYSDADGKFAAAQALYDTSAPFEQLAVSKGGSLSWGGLIRRDGRWLMAQGWDARPDRRELFFYTADQ
jgi:beta-1,2-mannosidase